ncbi:alpha/beta hydrolase [Haladaptatus pallidirubidus]|uniref:Alpha/beta hydrolase n=1 Tax=Haladaptatus pallidirubidus TaxID=1008152 RepID=A0AAV3UG67_9EURY|nr:alpha/beta hydrolase [Haladaptatus pallidirubidus]
MQSNKVVVPGARNVRATLNAPEGETDEIVVACPPHPQFNGNRRDNRLVALGEYLTDHGIACLRFDYGDWDEGYGEREDARNALQWGKERYDFVGIFGFSFGGGVAALAGADEGAEVIGLLAPASRLADDLDAVEVLDEINVPLKILYATRDDTANWEPLVERAEELGFEVEGFSADHFFVGQEQKVARRLGEFFVKQL